ncbi:hypothetical protein PRUPE_4G172500 [Prunus persica]|uniref:Uncharacterized protein n=1 Tax=Prunus persica TaxID=3760 RepID=A0A251PLW1_PRUPE|nr:hypothetical protein PRUPE_4G172500 [Prunus persica]
MERLHPRSSRNYHVDGELIWSNDISLLDVGKCPKFGSSNPMNKRKKKTTSLLGSTAFGLDYLFSIFLILSPACNLLKQWFKTRFFHFLQPQMEEQQICCQSKTHRPQLATVPFPSYPKLHRFFVLLSVQKSDVVGPMLLIGSSGICLRLR